jgi:uncharacterized membrane protein
MAELDRAWSIVREDLFAWVLLTTLFLVIVVASGGLGFLLYGNLLRAAGRAIDARAPPEIGHLFEFSDVGDEIVTILIKLLADSLGITVCLIGVLVTHVLTFWLPHLAIEGRYDPVAATRACFAHTSKDPSAIFAFNAELSLLNSFGLLCCCVGLLLTLPITLVAMDLHWREHRDEVYAAADAAGVPRLA